MQATMRKYVKGIFVAVNILSSLAFLFASYNHFFDPYRYWYIAVLGLGLPILICIQLLLCGGYLLSRSRWAIVPFIALLAGFPAVRTVIAFHLPQPFIKEKSNQTLRVLSWNVSWFDGQSNKKRKPERYRQTMLDYIRDQQADVLCFQEYLEPGSKGIESNHSAVLQQMGYTYYHWVGDYLWRDGRLNAGTAIFSKYPIVQKYRWKYKGLWFERAAESLIAVDIDFKGTTIRVFSTHLQSLQFNEHDYRTLEQLPRPEKESVKASISILRKLRQAYKYRMSQAELVREKWKESPHPQIICGDFNDVPGSYAYTVVRGDMKDAFLERGTGIGRTFNDISPTLRIDYILAHPHFKVVQFKKKEFPFTDHYPIIADLTLQQ